MQKRDKIWIGVLVAIIGVYIYMHRPQPQPIQISTSIRAMPRRRGSATTFPVYITLDKYYKLNSIIVRPLDEPTNSVHHEMWHMVATNGSEPVKMFTYGENVQGMQPNLKGVKPEPLIAGARYEVTVTSGKLKGTSKPFTTQLLP